MLTQIKHLVSSLMARVVVTREEGQALVEYSLILALVSVAAILILTTLGTSIVGVLGEVVAAL
jgi:Flp pilus assembly pilin Flp